MGAKVPIKKMNTWIYKNNAERQLIEIIIVGDD